MGKTGAKGANAIHLHIQARNKFGNLISPDLVFAAGAKKGKPSADFSAGEIDFDPEEKYSVTPRFDNGLVCRDARPETKWVVEVIGEGGRIDATLGEFFDYQSASYCSLKWSQARPNDLRLTREREVKLR